MRSTPIAEFEGPFRPRALPRPFRRRQFCGGSLGGDARSIAETRRSVSALACEGARSDPVALSGVGGSSEIGGTGY